MALFAFSPRFEEKLGSAVASRANPGLMRGRSGFDTLALTIWCDSSHAHWSSVSHLCIVKSELRSGDPTCSQEKRVIRIWDGGKDLPVKDRKSMF
ncbi:hypothetical protein CDAR_296681 [Caerostris darwini]|uniref:Uncharacterized protein n=1 Tax=Caerostris darwini TaxID=1538125 RepID=A0AAV4QI77_9ARAC|nr:hypothetical protein CDAR_296681 [Caerostris darwini]